jgi:hypothetical protein
MFGFLPAVFTLPEDNSKHLTRDRAMSKRRDYIKNLLDNGWKRLGTGHFSEAFGKGSRVVKVSFMNKDGKGPDHDGYLAYASWVVLNGADNPHFPKIFNLEIIHDCEPVGDDDDDDNEDHSFFTVELERLTPLDEYEADYDTARRLFRVAAAGFNGHSLERALGDEGEDEGEEFTSTPDTAELRECDCGACNRRLRAWEAFLARRDAEAEGSRETATAGARLAAAHEAGAIVREAFSGLAGFDFHDGNAMIRETDAGPQLVITDPVSWFHDYEAASGWITEAVSVLDPQYKLPLFGIAA